MELGRWVTPDQHSSVTGSGPGTDGGGPCPPQSWAPHEVVHLAFLLPGCGGFDGSGLLSPRQVDKQEMRKQQDEITAIIKMRIAGSSSGTQVAGPSARWQGWALVKEGQISPAYARSGLCGDPLGN